MHENLVEQVWATPQPHSQQTPSKILRRSQDCSSTPANQCTMPCFSCVAPVRNDCTPGLGRNPPITTFDPGLGEFNHPRLLKAQFTREHALLSQVGCADDALVFQQKSLGDELALRSLIPRFSHVGLKTSAISKIFDFVMHPAAKDDDEETQEKSIAVISRGAKACRGILLSYVIAPTRMEGSLFYLKESFLR
ncbi:hypothetical protein SISNIDRAFT_489032 [Sistotremastrum niveocremeum HHB9708]|uniref:Uncharacterized protein n=1 Tax=Sistotremastrum niveocremeum HHB9708 TaxID=1314777 RepID=A0A164QF12_9AGAM|nr:hypothetical protein SISNIDRAFT_489032 [Sistotremastrum niveocremeum HHB9708]